MKKIYNISLIILIIIIVFSSIFVLSGNLLNNSKYNTSELEDKLSLDMNNWNYDQENDIYYKLGNVYCTNPASTDYESLGIYVPGKYFDATRNDDGTYNCSINKDNKVANYTANNAPFVMPINTAGYSAQLAPTKYSGNEVKEYTSAGCIYVSAGCRGRDNGETFSGGAPWGVTDLKAAIRYIRFNKDNLPGDSEKIFTFGHSGGGAQSAIVGASGDSELYTPYLELIGAAMVDKNGNSISDSVYGSMCWCPITSLDYADEAYEWSMGQYSNSSSRSNDTWTSSLSDDLSVEYASYINNLKLKDPNGNVLTLNESENNIYASGSYYDYLKSTIEESLNNFINDTEFPYTASDSMDKGMNQQMPMNDDNLGGNTQSDMPNNSQMPPQNDMENSQQDTPDSQNMGDISSNNNQMPNSNQNLEDNSKGMTNSQETYNTVEDYINSLNNNEKWVNYDNSTKTVSISSVEAFIKHCKNPSKNVGAFDDLNKTQAENNLFGNNDSNYLHFDRVLCDLLSKNKNKYSQFNDFNSSIINEYNDDLKSVDSLNNTIEYRQNMYNPMYYLCDYYNATKTSKVAKYWRISSGIEQSDTSLTVEMNLYLALLNYDDVDNVTFQTVWNQGHTEAERKNTSTENFISWINNCTK